MADLTRQAVAVAADQALQHLSGQREHAIEVPNVGADDRFGDEAKVLDMRRVAVGLAEAQDAVVGHYL